MLVLEAYNIKKYFGDRLIIELDNLKIYSQDRIGIVGLNGAGKTTLMNILSGIIPPDEGAVNLYGPVSYITQLEEVSEEKVERKVAGEFNVSAAPEKYMSGGEKTRLKIAQSLSNNSRILFADEPTSNLDIKGIELLEEKLKNFKGAVVIISHDRGLLDGICTKIIEIENGGLKFYTGNYSGYRVQKEMELSRQHFEYEEYTKEKRKLERAIAETKDRVRTMRKAPRRMGNSEARLHKGSTSAKKARLERVANAFESRIEQLQVKEKPKEASRTKIDIQESEKLHSKIVISGKDIRKSFGSRVIFEKFDLNIENDSKTALIGDNGTGKTTLLNMILSGECEIRISNAARVGYFSQDMNILDEDLSILDNVISTSIYDETFVRITLARLLIQGDAVYKRVSLLSGGERVKVSFAKILMSDINMLILDEPTNYLDIYSQEALEDVLSDYEGTLLFVSHDRRFISNIADHILQIENRRVISFDGSFEEYLESRSKAGRNDDCELKKDLMVLETRLAVVMGKLSMPGKNDDTAALDGEFRELVRKIKEAKDKL